MDNLAAIILAVASLVTALATLVTTLRTHAAVQTNNGKTLGQIADGVQADRTEAAEVGGRRADDKQEPLA